MVFAALVACGLVFWIEVVENGGPDQGSLVRQLSQLGMSFYIGIATVQVVLALVAAPAATAGSVRPTALQALDRDAGDHLSDLEIVLGKLCGRLLPVVSMIFAGLPVLAVAVLLGGIIPSRCVLVVITIALTVLGGVLALAPSVRMSRPHEVLTIVYTVFTVWCSSRRSARCSRPPASPAARVDLQVQPVRCWPGGRTSGRGISTRATSRSSWR